jgi:anti-sigma factor RsiW
MKHPDQASLALHAGGDLGFFARWRIERHLAGCDRCRDEVDAFVATREIIPDLAEIPEVPWNRLAAEMRANIRLGLEAGECVRSGDVPLRQTPWFTGVRAAVALASVAALLVTGIVLERPAPNPLTAAADEITVVQATDDGIQVRRGAQSLGLMNPDRLDPQQRVTYSTDAQGSMGARYVDPDTGNVTINRVQYAD